MTRPTAFLLALAAAALHALLAAAPAPARDLADGLVAYYPFDGGADDASGLGNHGTVAGTTVLTTDRFGNPDSAYLFDGLTSRITVPGSPSLDSADTAVTMAAWIERAGWSLIGQPYGPVLMKSEESANAFMYRLSVGEGNLGLAIGNWLQNASAPFASETGAWYHVAGAWDGETAFLYVDGQLAASAPLAVTAAPDGRPLVIGADDPGILEVFNGKIDEVRIYNRALAPAEIAALAEQPVAAADLAPPAPLRLTGAPNPFNPSTELRFTLAGPATVTLTIHDLAGRRVATLLDAARPAGTHTATWRGRRDDGRAVASGVYLARLRAEGQTGVCRLVLAK